MKNNIFRFAEPFFFLVLLIANLSPLFNSQYFPTLDGVAHLYNSQLIAELLAGHNTYLQQFYTLNSAPIPNWMGHFTLTLFNYSFPAHIADKILLLLYFAGLPLSFRLLMKTIGSPAIIFSYAIFPFTYSFVLLYGFYNFCISLIFLFLGLSYWYNNRGKKITFQRWLLFSLLFLTIYFSHIFTLFIFIGITGLHILFEYFFKVFSKGEKSGPTLSTLWFQSRSLLIYLFPTLLLVAFYLYTNPILGEPQSIPFEKLVNDLATIGSLIAYLPEFEEIYTRGIFWILTATFFIVVMLKALSAFPKIPFPRIRTFLARFRIFSFRDFWLVAAAAILFLYFYLPDSNGSAGYISSRLSLLFFMFLIIWFSTQKIPWWMSGLTVVAILYCHFQLHHFYREKLSQLNGVARNCSLAAASIEANSTVLPLHYTWDWMDGHFSNYLGVDKPLVILDNYEAIVGYFPVQWNDPEFPNLTLGGTTSADLPCINWKTNIHNPTQEIDYIFFLGTPPESSDACQQSVKKIIAEHYVLIYENRDCTVYRNKEF